MALLCASAQAQLRRLDTPHYHIHTDLDQRLAEDLALRMEAMHAEYSARLSTFAAQGATDFDVYIYKHRADYQRLVGDRLTNTGGIFMARKSMLAAVLESQGRDGLRRTLQHEAFHQFAFTAIGPNVPVWLSEGMAQIFEEGIWTGRQFMIGQVPPRRLRQLQQDIRDGRLMPFRQFLIITDEQWHKDLRDPPTAATRYNQAWAMTHFLIFSTDQENKPKYRARLINMLRQLKLGSNAADSFAASFSDNIDGFQQRFVEYARSLQPTREARFIEGQAELADLVVALDQQGHHFRDAESFRAFITNGGYRLRYTKGNIQWSTGDPAEYFRDAAGRSMTNEQFFFSMRGGAPLPDIVCRPIDGLQFRTIFHDAPGQPDHETIIEAK